MQRRKLLRSAGMGGGAAVAVGTFAAPSIAQTMPEPEMASGIELFPSRSTRCMAPAQNAGEVRGRR